MTIFWIKIIACITMVIDHIKYAFPEQTYNYITLYFGRIAFPLFAFCAIQGYAHTSNFNKYIKRVFIGAIISQIPFWLFNMLPTLNRTGLSVFVTIFLGLLAIKSFEITENDFLKFLSIFTLAILASVINTDYGAYGVILMFSLYIMRNSKIKTAIIYIITVTSRYLIYMVRYYPSEYLIKLWLYTLIPLIFILFYNGKRGPKNQWFYYWFYPVHLLIFYLASPYTYNWFNL